MNRNYKKKNMNVAGVQTLQEVSDTKKTSKASAYLRSLPSHKESSFAIYDEHLLIKKLKSNINQLENKVEFFSFAISEIEDLTN